MENVKTEEDSAPCDSAHTMSSSSEEDSDQGDVTKLVLDFDPKTNKELVFVNSELVPVLKPHQVKGIKFMWQATCESIERCQKSGSEAILAHSMGLGKTLQYRAARLEDWHKKSGVCIIGYNLFTKLANEEGEMKEIFQKTLVNPGPDFVVCDEGHVLMNEESCLFKAVDKISTMRRLVLTGTPLQNNLMEYYNVIKFVRPNLLGSKEEFHNKFVKPIDAGSNAHATPCNVKRMKWRLYVLQDMLDSCIQWLDHTSLKTLLPLPSKMEYVILIKMSPLQAKMYDFYIKNLAIGGYKKSATGRPGRSAFLQDLHNLRRVWTHPMMLATNTSEKDEDLQAECDEDEEIDELDYPEEAVCKPASPSDDSPDGLTQTDKMQLDWWKEIVAASVDIKDKTWKNCPEYSGKMVILLNIMQDCFTNGERLIGGAVASEIPIESFIISLLSRAEA
ncbi:hypothetical protein HAZT_HAZT005278 [Hyalella azteca]|uniref:Helicase ATP-binding domain-containing protein n=1 Tax=Hyalella azteca TaxID=294128 RepID=A0A6A0H9Z4_HYAAZ|nr:hypothetical protein HAZT_HAZT005278 [Hyalella azteca]